MRVQWLLLTLTINSSSTITGMLLSNIFDSPYKLYRYQFLGITILLHQTIVHVAVTFTCFVATSNQDAGLVRRQRRKAESLDMHSNKVFVWGLNDRMQLGSGLSETKVQGCEPLSSCWNRGTSHFPIVSNSPTNN